MDGKIFFYLNKKQLEKNIIYWKLFYLYNYIIINNILYVFNFFLKIIILKILIFLNIKI